MKLKPVASATIGDGIGRNDLGWTARAAIAFLALGAGVLSGVAFEVIVTPVTISVERWPAMLALSPIVLTVGGNHYAAADVLRTPLTLLGLFSMPMIIGGVIWFMITPRLSSWMCLYFITSFFFAGIIHKTEAVLSV